MFSLRYHTPLHRCRENDTAGACLLPPQIQWMDSISGSHVSLSVMVSAPSKTSLSVFGDSYCSLILSSVADVSLCMQQLCPCMLPHSEYRDPDLPDNGCFCDASVIDRDCGLFREVFMSNGIPARTVRNGDIRRPHIVDKIDSARHGPREHDGCLFSAAVHVCAASVDQNHGIR